jgi:hypothetical protein
LEMTGRVGRQRRLRCVDLPGPSDAASALSVSRDLTDFERQLLLRPAEQRAKTIDVSMLGRAIADLNHPKARTESDESASAAYRSRLTTLPKNGTGGQISPAVLTGFIIDTADPRHNRLESARLSRDNCAKQRGRRSGRLAWQRPVSGVKGAPRKLRQTNDVVSGANGVEMVLRSTQFRKVKKCPFTHRSTYSVKRQSFPLATRASVKAQSLSRNRMRRSKRIPVARIARGSTSPGCCQTRFTKANTTTRWDYISALRVPINSASAVNSLSRRFDPPARSGTASSRRARRDCACARRV